MGWLSLLLFQSSCHSEASLTSALCSNNRWPPPRKVDHMQESEIAYCGHLSSSHTIIPLSLQLIF